MDVIEAEVPQEGTFYKKCKQFVKNLNLTFQNNVPMFILYSYGLIMLIANQDILWDHQFKDMETANCFGLELVPPEIDSNFGFMFRFITVLVNGLAVGAISIPNPNVRTLITPAVLWTFYTIVAIVHSTLARVWVLYMLEAPFLMYLSVFAVGMFAVVTQTQLAFNVFYDHY